MSAREDLRPARRWRKPAIVAITLLGLWVLAAAWLLGTAWHSVPRYEPASVPPATASILSHEAYGERIDSHARPYVYRLDSPAGGSVLVFGAEHTMQPDDPQLDEVRARWSALRPTVALIESDLGMLFPAFMDPVRTFGEPGLVYALARADSIETYTWEPPDAVVLRAVLAHRFAREQVALRWILGPYFSNLRHGRPADPEGFVQDTLAERSSAPGIEGALTSVAEVDAAWGRAFPDGPDWRDVSDQYGLPGFLGEMDLNAPRDVHLVACVAELMRDGQRVFVICGSSHAVKIEPALAALCTSSDAAAGARDALELEEDPFH